MFAHSSRRPYDLAVGWHFKGVYTVGTWRARQWLTRDDLVRGTWAHIAPADAPDALLPRVGLLVVHGFGVSFYRGETPWDAFAPRRPQPEPPHLPPDLYTLHRPPAALVGWMAGLTRDTGVPVALYQCEMSGGIDAESALVCDADEVTLTVRGPRGFRQWRDGRWERARTDPLQTMLRALWARPDGWVFPPHERPFDNPLRPPLDVLRRRSPYVAALLGDGLAVRNLLAHHVLDEWHAADVLAAAAASGSAEAVGLLLAHGAPVDKLGPVGHAANPDCAGELLEAGASLDGSLADVVGRGYDATARYLVARACPVDFRANHHGLWFAAAAGGIGWLIDRALADGVDIDVTDAFRGPALVAAVRTGRASTVDRLLAAGATVTPGAVAAAAGHGRTAILRTLLDRGGDPDSHDLRGTALYQAADGGFRDTVALLLGAGADPAAVASGRGVALAGACYGGNVDVVDLLLSAAPGLVNDTGAGDLTPLWGAVGRGNQIIVDLLLAHGADTRQSTPWSYSLGDYAVRNGVSLA
jgi:ankyrin repeat protein